MTRKNPFIAIVLVVFLLLQAIVMPATAGSGPGHGDVKENAAEDLQPDAEEGLTVFGQAACGILDLKHLEGSEDYALLLSWRLPADEGAGTSFAVELPQELALKSYPGDGDCIGHISNLDNPDTAIMDVYYTAGRLEFVLTDDGADLAAESHGLYGTNVFLPLTAETELTDQEVTFSATDLDGRDTDMTDTVDSVYLEELLDDDQLARMQEVLKPSEEPATDQASGHELAITSQSAALTKEEAGLPPAAEPSAPAEEAADTFVAEPKDPASPGLGSDLEEKAVPTAEASEADWQPVFILPAKGTNLLLITDDLTEERAGQEPVCYHLFTQEGKDSQTFMGNYYLAPDSSLVLYCLEDGNYTLTKAGNKKDCVAFTLVDGQLYWHDEELPENILKIQFHSNKKSEDKKQLDDFLASPEKEPDVALPSQTKGALAHVDIILVDDQGNPINPLGASYDVLQIHQGTLEKVADLNWENPVQSLEKYQLNQLKRDRSGLSVGAPATSTDASLLDLFNPLILARLDDKAVDALKVMATSHLAVPEGEYILQEVTPPVGFQATGGEIPLTVTEDSGNDLSRSPEKEQALVKEENPTTSQEKSLVAAGSLKEADMALVALSQEKLPESSLAVQSSRVTPVFAGLNKLVTGSQTEDVASSTVGEKGMKPVSGLAVLDDRAAPGEDIQADKQPAEKSTPTTAESDLVRQPSSLSAEASIDRAQQDLDSPADALGYFTVKTNPIQENKGPQATMERDISDLEPARMTLAYRAMASGPSSSLQIRTVNEGGDLLFFGGTSGQEIGNLRDPNLNHDATYGIYKWDEKEMAYKPYSHYQVKNANGEWILDETGQPKKVNYQHGHYGVVTLNDLSPGRYLVKEFKSVFQYAYKNLGMTLTVGEDGSISQCQEVKVSLAAYEEDAISGETGRKKITYNQKIDRDSQRIISEGEVKEVTGAGNIDTEANIPGPGKTVVATYHQGNLRVKKVDKDGNPIAGVALELHGHDANRNLRIYRVITDENGIAEFHNLNVPSYHLLKEVEAPDKYALPDHQWMIYFGEGTWVEFDENHKPKAEHIPLQISDNQVYATKVGAKPVIPLNPQGTRQIVEDDKYRPLIDGVTGASIAPKNWFQFLGIDNPSDAPAEDTPEASSYWAANWNNPDYFRDGSYEKSFNQSKDGRFYAIRETLTKAADNSDLYEFTVTNNPRARVIITKKDEAGAILPGATFGLYHKEADGSLRPAQKSLTDWTEVSGMDGRAIFDNIPAGNYVIREDRAPGGYQGDATEYAITVDKDANISFKETFQEAKTLYSNMQGTVDYTAYNWLGGLSIQDRFTVNSKIVDVDTAKKQFTQIFYLQATDMLKNGQPINLGDFTISPRFQVTPYINKRPNTISEEHMGIDKSSVVSIDSFASYGIVPTATGNPMPADFNLDLKDTSIYQPISSGPYEANNSLTFTGVNSPQGVIIKITGSYDGEKPILTQGIISYLDSVEAYSHAGVAFTEKEIPGQRQSELAFDVTNHRNEETPLDKKGTINLRKVIAGEDTLLAGAEFGLFTGRYDQLKQGQSPFATATSTDQGLSGVFIGKDKPANIQFKDIPPGTYTLKELNAPLNYEKTLYSWTVEVAPSGMTLIRLNPTFEEDPTLEEPVNVNDKVHPSDFNFIADNSYNQQKIAVNKSEFFKMSFKIMVDDGIKKGNYFTIRLDDRLNMEGTLAQTDVPAIELNGYVLATGEQIGDGKTLKYTFTDLVEKIKNISATFHFAVSPDRYQIRNDESPAFDINIAGKDFRTGNLQVDYTVYNNAFWLSDGQYTYLSSFIQTIDNINANVEMAAYLRPVGNLGDGWYRVIRIEPDAGILSPITNSRYEIYRVINPDFDGNNHSQSMPRSFGVDYTDTSKYERILEGSVQADGKIRLPDTYKNDHLIIRGIAPYDIKQERAQLNIYSDIYYGNYTGYSYSVGSMSETIVKPSQIFAQSDLTEGEVLAFNKRQAPMVITLWKKDMDGNLLEPQLPPDTLEFNLRVAEDYPDSSPVPKELEKITLNLPHQKDGGAFIPLSIPIPAGISGEYILTETKAPKGYIINGLQYRIKIDAKKRTIQLLEVRDAAGKPSPYKFKKGATEVTLSATHPATLYKEVTNADGQVVVDQENIQLDVLDPAGEYPKAGGLGVIFFYLLGIALMVLAGVKLYRHKETTHKDSSGK